MLSTNIKNTDELISIALQTEREAIRRYTQLAAKMHEGSNEKVARLFERIISEEQEHESSLLAWMKKEDITEKHNIGSVDWQDPLVSTTYDDEACDPYYSTPYKALAYAVHNKEIAFSFYVHIAADSDNLAVREYAEKLARDELGHAALLRAERRIAYHAERESKKIEPRLDPKAIHSESDLLAAVIYIDRQLADKMGAISNESAAIADLSKKTLQEIANNESTLSNMAAPGEDITKSLQQIDIYNTQMDKESNSSEDRLNRLHACGDRSFAFYDAIVDSTSDEAVMFAAQKLSSSALDRISIIKQAIGNTASANSGDAEQGVYC